MPENENNATAGQALLAQEAKKCFEPHPELAVIQSVHPMPSEIRDLFRDHAQYSALPRDTPGEIADRVVQCLRQPGIEPRRFQAVRITNRPRNWDKGRGSRDWKRRTPIREQLSRACA